MTYARSYATSRRPQKIKRFRRPRNKRKIPQMYFRQNSFKRKVNIWPAVKACILTGGCLVAALTVLAGFSLMLVAGYQYVVNMPYFCLKEDGITITGQVRANPAAILREMQIRPGTSLLAVVPAKVERALLQQPWVESVELSRVWPDQIRLHIREHQPVAVVNLDKKLYLMNDRGILFKVLEPHDPHELPVITGLEVQHFQRVAGTMSPLLAKVFDFLNLLQDKRFSLRRLHRRDPCGCGTGFHHTAYGSEHQYQFGVSGV